MAGSQFVVFGLQRQEEILLSVRIAAEKCGIVALTRRVPLSLNIFMKRGCKKTNIFNLIVSTCPTSRPIVVCL